jgi:hypothetical protein
MVSQANGLEVHKLGGVDALFQFRPNHECVSIDILQLTKEGVVVNQALVPHHHKPIENYVPEAHQAFVLQDLNRWYEIGYLQPAEYGYHLLRFFADESRAYAFITDPRVCQKITDDDLSNLARLYFESMPDHYLIEYEHILDDLWFLNSNQILEFRTLCYNWGLENDALILKEVKRVSDWGLGQLNIIVEHYCYMEIKAGRLPTITQELVMQLLEVNNIGQLQVPDMSLTFDVTRE